MIKDILKTVVGGVEIQGMDSDTKLRVYQKFEKKNFFRILTVNFGVRI